jgi:hypothetical protein
MLNSYNFIVNEDYKEIPLRNNKLISTDGVIFNKILQN